VRGTPVIPKPCTRRYVVDHNGEEQVVRLKPGQGFMFSLSFALFQGGAGIARPPLSTAEADTSTQEGGEIQREAVERCGKTSKPFAPAGMWWTIMARRRSFASRANPPRSLSTHARTQPSPPGRRCGKANPPPPNSPRVGLNGRVLATRKVDIKLPGKGHSSSHGASRSIKIISMMKWIRASRLSRQNSLSVLAES